MKNKVSISLVIILCALVSTRAQVATGGNFSLNQSVIASGGGQGLTGGASQSELITLEDVSVSNGVFTVPLKFGSTLTNNSNFKFLEIGVRAGASTGAFTLLAPRQPITSVPFAVNAQKAFDAQLVLTTGAPLAADCALATQYGQTRVDATNLRLYICTTTGWKFTVLQ